MGCAVKEKPALGDHDYLFDRRESDYLKKKSIQCHYEKDANRSRSAYACAGRNGHPVDANTPIQTATRAPKRSRVEDSDGPDGPKKSSGKRINKADASAPRYRCPFNMHDRKEHTKHACKGKGFLEMGKLKDHLKDVHHLSQELLKRLSFKEKRFTSLPMDQRVELVYQILFPHVPKDRIPSPLVNEENTMIDSLSTLNIMSNEVLRDIFIMLWKHRGADIKREYPRISAILPKSLTAVLLELTDEDTPGDAFLGSTKIESQPVEFYGVPTPPSSTRSSSRTAMEDEGYCGLSPLLTNEGPSRIEPFVPMQAAMHSQSGYNADAKPALTNEITKIDEDDQSGAPAFCIEHAAVKDHTTQTYTSQSGTAGSLDYNYDFTINVPLGCPGYTQPNMWTNPSFTPNPTFDDRTLYPSNYDIPTSPTKPSNSVWGPTLSSEQSQSGEVEPFSAYQQETLREEKEPTPPPSSYMEDWKTSDWMYDFLDPTCYASE